MVKSRRVVITGMGVVTSLGETLDQLWEALCAGRSGIGPLTLFDTKDFKVHFGGQVRDWDPVARFGAKEARHLDRFAQFAMAASMSAVEDSGIEFTRYAPHTCGVIIGSGIGGLNEFETPLRPSRRPDQNRSSVSPRPVTTPRPVITTRRGITCYVPRCS